MVDRIRTGISRRACRNASDDEQASSGKDQVILEAAMVGTDRVVG